MRSASFKPSTRFNKPTESIERRPERRLDAGRRPNVYSRDYRGSRDTREEADEGPIDASGLINRQIVKLVPNRGLINFVDRAGVFKRNVPIRTVLKHVDERNEKLIVASVSDNRAADQDPQLVCKVVPITHGNSGNSGYKSMVAKREVSEPAKKKKKPPSIKPVQVSWNIAAKDLNEQKSIALRSVLTKGNTLELELNTKGRQKRGATLTSLDLEQRHLLIEQCKEICSQWGDLQGRVEGSVTTAVKMTFRPKQT